MILYKLESDQTLFYIAQNLKVSFTEFRQTVPCLRCITVKRKGRKTVVRDPVILELNQRFDQESVRLMKVNG
jgi:hypothetical protein